MPSKRNRYFEGRLLGADDLAGEQGYLRDRRSCRHAEADVILDVVYVDGLLFLVVAKIGDRPAHRVRVKFGEPFTGVEGTKRMQTLALFRKLEFLAPGRTIWAFLDRGTSYFARGEPTRLLADVTWQSDDGTRCTRAVRHDLEIYRDLGSIEREVPDHAGSA